MRFNLCLKLLLGEAFISRAQTLSDQDMQVVINDLAIGAQQPWELGTRAQALLEYSAPLFSVVSPNSASLPPPTVVLSDLAAAMAPILSIAKTTVANRSTSNGGIQGPQPLISDDSAADPASIGVAVLLANWTGQTGEDYVGAAQDQLDYLMWKVPKTPDGAISHRTQYLQLWSDFVYMVPPFLAYYGVLTNNDSLISESYNQIRLYRNYLVSSNSSAGSMWKHIEFGPVNQDPGHWATGNGWAAAGMLRVLATIKRSQFTHQFKSEQHDLQSWIEGIHNGIYPHLDDTYIFRNYPDNSNTFYDASSTALLASTVYRLATLVNVYKHIPQAELSRKALSAVNSSSSSYPSCASATASSSSSAPITLCTPLTHFDPSGWLTPVVDPYNYPMQGLHSPEGQAFIVEMMAAYHDWVALGSKDANDAPKLGEYYK